MIRRLKLNSKNTFSRAAVAGPWSSWILAAIAGIVQILCLARAPQNPDGAELVATAMQGGGVLHPPGYPLQSWLDLIFIHLPFGLPATRLALLSWICSVLTVFILSEVQRRLKCGFPARIFGVLGFYAFYPSIWSIGVQPEKYALSALLMAAVLSLAAEFCLDRKSQKTKPRLKHAIFLGFAVGLGAAQHTAMILVLPLIAAAGVKICWMGRDRWLKTFLAAGIAAFITGGLYLSLFLLSRGAVWPDWGKISTLHELIRHVLRSDFVFLGLSAMKSGFYYRGLEVFFSNYWQSYFILGLTPALGAILIWRRDEDRLFNRSLVVFFLLSLVFLWISKIHPPKLAAYCFLERYCMPLMLVSSVLAGFAFEQAWAKCQAKLRPFLALLAVILCSGLLYSGWDFADASKDRVLDIYREVLGATLDPQAVFITGNDLETLYGASYRGVARYSVIGDYPWALRKVDPLVEPRIRSFMKEPTGMNEISKAAYDAGYIVMSTFQGVLKAGSPLFEQRGLFWAAGKSIHHVLSENTVEAAVKTCAVIEGMDFPAPKEGHYYSQLIFEKFRYAFYGTTTYLENKGRKDLAELTRKISFGLFRGENPEEWISSCQELRRKLSR